MTKPSAYSIATEAKKPLRFITFAEARETAQNLAAECGQEFTVQHIATGAIAYQATPVPAGVKFTPWQRVETPKFEAPVIGGYTSAYTRSRVTATVYRANDHSGWLIHDGRTGGTVTVKNTKLACQVTSEMRQGRML